MQVDMREPPGPTQLQNLFLAPSLVRDPRKPIEEMTRRHGPVWQSVMPDQKRLVPLVWLMGQAGSERVLAPPYQDDFTWYEGYRFTMEPLFGRDILFLLDDEPSGVPGRREGAHRARHRLLIPAFHPRLDDTYLREMDAIVGRHLGRLPIGSELDLQWEIKRITFHIVARLLFGADDADLPHLMHLFELVGLGLFSLVHVQLPGLPFTRARAARAELAAYLLQKIRAYRSGEGTPTAMLAQLLSAEDAAGERLADETLVAEMIAFLFAGYDTTSSMLTSLFVALGDNPQVAARLTDALRAGAGSAALAPDCAYLDAVLLETERLYPPLLFAMRGVRRDFVFQGFRVARGTKVAYSPYYTGRQPELFPEPLRFRPERFLEPGEDGRPVVRRPPPYTVLGFGGGARTCIGKRFALLEMRLLVAALLTRFDLTAVPGQAEAVFFNPTLQRKNGYRVRLGRRAPAPGAA